MADTFFFFLGSPACGDGILDLGFGEKCDSGTGCKADCECDTSNGYKQSTPRTVNCSLGMFIYSFLLSFVF